MREKIANTNLVLLCGAVLILLGCPASSSSDEIIVIRWGEAPTVNGQVEATEWQDAGVASFGVDEDLDVSVLYKHDGVNLYLAYVYSSNDAGALVFPEVVIDPDLDRSAAWLPDDWWFHVSGSDCEARGTFGVYTNCAIQQPDWSGVPNFELSQNPPPLNEFEMRIPLAKLGVSVGDTLGIAFTVEYIPDRRGIWPLNAEVGEPDTWGIARLAESGTAVVLGSWSSVKARYR